MRFESRTSVRLGAMLGSMIGVLAMTVAISFGSCVRIGAFLVAAGAGIGFVIGNKLEKRKG